MASPASEQPGAGTQRGVQVEGRDRPSRSLPVALRAGDEHDGTVVTLDESRGDDPDHAFVPVGSGHGIAASCALLGRPVLDLGHGLAEDSTLDRLAFAVQLLE